MIRGDHGEIGGGRRTTTVGTPEQRHLVVDGIRLSVLDWGGDADAPTLLFLHGGALNAHTYDRVCQELREDYHCCSMDLRGHGDSEWSPVMDYDISTHARDVRGVVETLRPRRLVVVGMSLGGLTALEYAGQYVEDRLAALVIIDTAPEFRSEGSARIRAFLEQPGEFASVDEYVERALAFNPRRDAASLRRTATNNLRKTPGGTWTWKWDPRPRQRDRNDPRAEERRRQRYRELWEKVDRIACPTLVVRGAESEVFTEEDAARLTRRLRRGSSVVIEGAGHTVQGDNPAALVRAMRAFLDPLFGGDR